MNNTSHEQTVVNTRPRHQAESFSRKLRELHCHPIEFPTIQISEPDTWEPVDQALNNLSSYDWLVFTSQNGVETFLRRARTIGINPEEAITQPVAAIGPATARQLRNNGLSVELRPDEYKSEQLADALVNNVSNGGSLLLPRSNIARPVLVDTLRNQGYQVHEIHPYHLVRARDHDEDTIQTLSSHSVDLLTFTSSMTVNHFDHLIDKYDLLHLRDVPAACIGPITRETARENGYEIPVMAEEYTIDGLLRAIKEYLKPSVSSSSPDSSQETKG